MRDGLADRRGLLRHGALAVDDLERPADGGSRLLHAGADAQRATVPLVGGDVDDGLAGLPPWGLSSGRPTGVGGADGGGDTVARAVGERVLRVGGAGERPRATLRAGPA